ncbi:MAG: Ig-like domain-containing protein [Pseudomarimonas sp.]
MAPPAVVAVASVLMVFAMASPVARAATITLVPGAGFADTTPVAPEGGNTGTTLGQQRTILFNAAANRWGVALTSSQTIKVAAAFESLPCGPTSGALGSAGATTAFVLEDEATPSNSRFFPVALAEALSARNLNGSEPEISASFNSRIDLNDSGCLGNTRWYYGLTGPAPANTIALYPTVLHEIGHGLGFAALICENPGGCGADAPYGGFIFGIPDIWADFLRDNNINGAGANLRWIDMSNAQRIVSFTHDPLLVWDGMSVTARLGNFGQTGNALNEGRMRMYAPNPFEGGSSISHFHEDAAPNLLMEPIADANVFTQTDLTDCLFADIGWTNSRCPTVINSAPTLNAISNPAPITQNSGPQTVNLAGIGDGDAAATQALTVTASSANTSLIPNPSVTYTSPNTTGSLSYTPVTNQTGSAVITVRVTDDGGTSITNGGVDQFERSITVNVSAANAAPSASNLSAAEIYIEDTPLDLVNIVVSDADSPMVTATLTLSDSAAGSLSTATSGTVTSTYVASTGVWSASGLLASVNTLLAGVTFNPAAHFNADFTIATRVTDGFSTAQTGTKVVSGTAVNDPPMASNLSLDEDYVEDQPLNLADIVIAELDSADVTALLTLSNTTAGSLSTASSGSVTSTYVTATGVWAASGAVADVNHLLADVSFTPAANFNSALGIGTSISDNEAPSITGNKLLTGVAVNDPPTLNAISSPAAIPINSGMQMLTLAGIGAGIGDPPQSLAVSAVSNRPELVPHPSVGYTSPNPTGTLSFTPVAGQSGTAIITVTVTDGGGTVNGGVDQFSRSFSQQVLAAGVIFLNGFE